MANGWMRLIAVLMLLVMMPGCERTNPPTVEGEFIDAVINGEHFRLELALDGESRRQGLSDRKSLASDTGMLFVFAAPRKSTFVMRRCHFPIDLVQIGPGGRVDRLHRMKVEPLDTPEKELHRYTSDGEVQFAIEFAAGTIDRVGVEPGQRIDLPFDALKRRAR